MPRIQNVIREEEEQFLRTWRTACGCSNDIFRKTKAAGSDVIGGDAAFDLHVDLRHPRRGDREPGGRPEPARGHGRVRGGARTSSPQVSRGTTEAADVFATGPLDTLKEAYHHGTEFLGYETDRGRRRP